MHSPKASNRCKMHRFGTTSFGAHGVLRFTVADTDKMASADLESLAGLGPVRDE